MKVFLGLNNIASVVTLLKDGFEAIGIPTLTATLHEANPLKSRDVHFQIGEMIPEAGSFQNAELAQQVRELSFATIKQYVWEKALRECDVFFFIWQSFEQDLSDFRKLKEAGKKIVVQFCGDDVRWPPAANQELEGYGLHPMRWEAPYMAYLKQAKISDKLHLLRVAEKYADLLIGGAPTMQLALRPYSQVWQPVNLDLFEENTDQREVPVVVHAPTDRAFKGTDYVLDAARRLEDEGVAFELKLVEKMPFDEVRKVYTDSDILVGQLISPNGGGQERECLASGMVVLSSIGIDYPPLPIPDDCPVVPVTPQTVYDALKTIIQDHPRRLALARRGRSYVAKYHDAKLICRNILDRLEDPDGAQEIAPHFFRDRYVPASVDERHLCNLYTDFVKECDWYREHVAPGERDGLRF